jgi:hypothetical protein
MISGTKRYKKCRIYSLGGINYLTKILLSKVDKKNFVNYIRFVWEGLDNNFSDLPDTRP